MLATDTRVGLDICPTLTVISQGGGRIRVRVNGFDVDETRAVAIEEAAGTVDGVLAVRAYPRSASVVIWYSPDDCDTAAVLSAIDDAQHIPAGSVPARAPHSVRSDEPGVVQRIASGIYRLLGLAPGPTAEPSTGGAAAMSQRRRATGRRQQIPRVSSASGCDECGWPCRWGWCQWRRRCCSAHPGRGGWPSRRRCRCNSWPAGRS